MRAQSSGVVAPQRHLPAVCTVAVGGTAERRPLLIAQKLQSDDPETTSTLQRTAVRSAPTSMMSAKLANGVIPINTFHQALKVRAAQPETGTPENAIRAKH